MDIRDWWPRLTDTTRVWLLQHNGSPLPPEVSSDILTVGGPSTTQLGDAEIDWIEAVANGETPS